ncbi:hypothetical protein Pelo_9477 [Pelomyxa schiedti]|nr:hypothetical protein Pelo_9477 [Pelomyxa schiedti]
MRTATLFSPQRPSPRPPLLQTGGVNKTVNVQQLRKEMREERNAELGDVKNMPTAISLKLGIPESPDSWVENLSRRRYPVQAGEQGL